MSESAIIKKKEKSANWTTAETTTFIDLCIAKRIPSLMNGKKFRNAKIFCKVKNEMQNHAYFRDVQQLICKFKQLKGKYKEESLKLGKSGMGSTSWPYFEAMKALLHVERIGVDPVPAGEEVSIEEEVCIEEIENEAEDIKFLEELSGVEEFGELDSGISSRKRKLHDGKRSVEEVDALLRFKRQFIEVDSAAFLREKSAVTMDQSDVGKGLFGINKDNSRINADNSVIDADRFTFDLESGATGSRTKKIGVVPAPSEVTLFADSNDTPTKTSGRLSCKRRAQEFSEIFCSKQAAMFNEILEKQNKSLEESIRKQLQQQRNWEMHILQQQYENQMEQNRTLLDEFFKRLQPTTFLPEPVEDNDDSDDNINETDCNIKVEREDF